LRQQVRRRLGQAIEAHAAAAAQPIEQIVKGVVVAERIERVEGSARRTPTAPLRALRALPLGQHTDLYGLRVLAAAADLDARGPDAVHAGARGRELPGRADTGLAHHAEAGDRDLLPRADARAAHLEAVRCHQLRTAGRLVVAAHGVELHVQRLAHADFVAAHLQLEVRL